MRALVVSRTPAARAWMRAALGPGWACDEAADGLQALSLARADRPDVVIADQSTEPFGAFGLTRDLKIFARPPAVVIVLDRTQDVWLATWSGADAWLVQPVDAFALARTASEVAAAGQPAGTVAE